MGDFTFGCKEFVLDGFGDRLAEAVRLKKNPVMVGLDPRFEQLPEGLVLPGATAQQIAAAYETFCRGIIDVVASLVPIVKPQMAFFEQLGGAGMNALANTVSYARSKGLLVVLDGKRNDIGSTATAYAQAYVSSDAHGIPADALTVSPYLGADSIQPFADAVAEHGTGIFVLVKTSNPGGGMLQDLVADGKAIYQHVAHFVQDLSESSKGASGYGPIGAVVGATYPEQLAELRKTMRNVWILVPGFGAQGGTAKDVGHAFDENGLGAVINSSRGIIFAHNRPEYAKFGSNWQQAVEAATNDMISQLQTDTPAKRLLN